MKRLHVHVGVTDLSTSIGFYSTLFGAEPTVTKDDYAKWMLEDPRVNFAISSGNHAAKGIEHQIRVEPALQVLRQHAGELDARPIRRGMPHDQLLDGARLAHGNSGV